MAQITWTNEAEHWLKEIHDYIAQDNPTVYLLKKTGEIEILGVFHGALEIERYLVS